SHGPNGFSLALIMMPPSCRFFSRCAAAASIGSVTNRIAIAAEAAAEACRKLRREAAFPVRSNGVCMLAHLPALHLLTKVKHMARFCVYLSNGRFPLLTEGSGATVPSVTKGACDTSFSTNTMSELSFKFRLRLAASLLMLSVFLGAAWARERGPRVEVVCPQRPIPFPLDKQ